MTPVKLSEIDLADRRYQLFSPAADTHSLAGSIRLAGLINPVLLRPGDDKCIIVSGFNRIAACRLNRMETVSSIVLHPDIDHVSCLFKAISSKAFLRPLSQPEIIRCLCVLSGHLDAGEIAARSQAVFNCRLNEHFIQEMIQIGGLPEPAERLISQGRLSIKTARAMGSLCRENLGSALLIFSRIKASASVQMEILTHLKEISIRDGISFEQLAGDQRLKTELDRDDSDTVLKTRKVREIIYQLRYPELSKALENKKQMLHLLKPEARVRIEIPDYFESPDIRFSFTAATRSDFKNQVKALDRLSGRSDFSRLFRL